MIYNLSNKNGLKKAESEFLRLKTKQAIIDIKEVKKTRTSLQNRSLHLMFTQIANELNNIGVPFVWHGLNGKELECQWTGELFKERSWKPLQEAMFGIKSTTKLNTAQINELFDVFCKFFADKGIEISFPNKFEYYLKFYNIEK